MPKTTPDPDISDDVLGEGCYFLSHMGLTPDQIASHFETTPARVRKLVKEYTLRLSRGEAVAGEIDKVFWEDVKKEAEGDVKLTFMSEKGFHHSWKSELARLDGSALMAIYEQSKDFLGADPNQKFLDFPPPKGYDPLALDREVRKAVGILGELLAEKWKSETESRKTRGSKLN